jgi:hypothetical protein
MTIPTLKPPTLATAEAWGCGVFIMNLPAVSRLFMFFDLGAIPQNQDNSFLQAINRR